MLGLSNCYAVGEMKEREAKRRRCREGVWKEGMRERRKEGTREKKEGGDERERRKEGTEKKQMKECMRTVSS